MMYIANLYKQLNCQNKHGSLSKNPCFEFSLIERSASGFWDFVPDPTGGLPLPPPLGGKE